MRRIDRPKVRTEVKVCKACCESKELSQFHKKATRKDGLAPDCKTCANRARRKRKEKSPDKYDPRKARQYFIKYKYNLTPEQYKEMYEAQGGVCAICREVPLKVIDHDHVTGEVRGLLCHNCNVGLGFFRDSIDFLLRAADYLRP